MKLKCPYRIKSLYDMPKYKSETLVPVHKIEIIYVPDYAIDYVLDYFYKKGILAVEYKDLKIFEKYFIYPRYVIKRGKFNEPN